MTYLLSLCCCSLSVCFCINCTVSQLQTHSSRILSNFVGALSVTDLHTEARDPLCVAASFVPDSIHAMLAQEQVDNPDSSETQITRCSISSSSCVLVADIAGFTPFVERLSGFGADGIDRMAGHLCMYMKTLTDTVSYFHGDTIKFAGDAIICVFNPKSGAETADDVVHRTTSCAIQLSQCSHNYAAETSGSSSCSQNTVLVVKESFCLLILRIWLRMLCCLFRLG